MRDLAMEGLWSSSVEGHYDPFKIYKLDTDVSIPFTATRRCEVRIYSVLQWRALWELDLGSEDFVAIGAIKGAPEVVLKNATYTISESGKRLYVDWRRKLSENEKECLIHSANRKMCMVGGEVCC